MRDYAEIAHNLRCCGVGVPCDDCTYQDDIVKCGSLEGQAANAIEELLAESADLVGQVKRSQEEIRKLDKLLAAVPKWISVEERLPEKDEMVIVYYSWIGQSGTEYKEVSLATLDEIRYCGSKLLGWMPLPEPPKEVE